MRDSRRLHQFALRALLTFSLDQNERITAASSEEEKKKNRIELGIERISGPVPL